MLVKLTRFCMRKIFIPEEQSLLQKVKLHIRWLSTKVAHTNYKLFFIGF